MPGGEARRPAVVHWPAEKPPGRSMRDRGSQMTDQTAADRMMSGKAWEDFCDALKEAGKIVQRPEVPNDTFNKALGYRFLTALLRGGLESTMHFADPQFPGFFRLADETKKLLN